MGVCGDTGNEYETSGREKVLRRVRAAVAAAAAVAVGELRPHKISIILETLVIHFLSHLHACSSESLTLTDMLRWGLRYGPCQVTRHGDMFPGMPIGSSRVSVTS